MYRNTNVAVKETDGMFMGGATLDPFIEKALSAQDMAWDIEAFAALVQPHLRLFTSGIQRILQDEHRTQAALEKALLSIYCSLGQSGETCRFTTWAYRICLNEALKMRRQSLQGPSWESASSLDMEAGRRA
jgi:RNA polymerase sigma-70 factor (ECF subfamily)